MRLILDEIDVLTAWNPYMYNVYMPSNAVSDTDPNFREANHSEAVRWKIAFWQRFKKVKPLSFLIFCHCFFEIRKM